MQAYIPKNTDKKKLQRVDKKRVKDFLSIY